ncbi:30S ribosomal protein S9 [Candidatus Micrarchaeota archaeon]|nr:30S ribosomal protein S9 [Candidatus Micrarchaeota archaeon]
MKEKKKTVKKEENTAFRKEKQGENSGAKEEKETEEKKEKTGNEKTEEKEEKTDEKSEGTKIDEKEKTEEAEETGKIKKKKKKVKKSKKYGIHVKAKKKEAVARATIKTGNGKIRINKRSIELIQPKYLNEFIREPLIMTGERMKEVNISVSTNGGGFMGQAVAARSAIAKSIIEYFNDEKLKQKMIKYDKMLLIDDPRRTEPKKPLGKKARKKKQKSKR